MDAVGFSESAPPLYYALAWVWTQVTGTGECGLRSLSAAGRGRARSRSPTCSAPSCAAAAPGSGRRRWSPSTRCCSGTRRRRAPTRCWSSSARSRCSTASAPLAAGRAPRLHPLGPLLRPRPRDPLLRRLPARRRGRSCCCAGAGARRSPGLGDPRRSSRRRWRRWPSTRCRSATPNGSATSRLGHRLWETAGDLRRRRDRRHHRPSPSARAGDRAAGARASPPSRLLRLARRPRGAAARPSLPLVGRRLPRSGSRWLLALALRRQGLRPRPQPDPGAGAAAGRGRDRRHACRGARRLGDGDRRRPGRLLARLLRLGQRLAEPAAPRLGRRSRRGSASRAAPRAIGHLDARRGLAALLPLDRRVPGPAGRTATTGWSHEIDFVSDGEAPPPPPRLLGPRFREARRRQRRPPLHPPLRAARARAWRRCGCASCATPSSNFRNTGVLLDGVGP